MLYAIDPFIKDDHFNDLLYHGGIVGSRPPGVVKDSKTVDSSNSYDPAARDGKIKMISHQEYPDFCEDLVHTMLPKFNSSLDPKSYEILEFNYIIYCDKGHHFKKHMDNNGRKWYNAKSVKEHDPSENKGDYRVFSAITVLKLSDDLQGCNLILWDDQKNIVLPDLKVKDTIIFDSSRHHQVTPLITGSREVLISWIYKI